MLPLFPLELVVYPGEKLSLHIFEKRYQQLILDCDTQNISFGIPTYLNNKLEYGTELFLKEIVKRYPGGESDVICIGKRIFRIKNYVPFLSERLYAGAEVEFLEDDAYSEESLQYELLEYLELLYKELTIDKYPIFKIPFVSYQVAHKIGLGIEQEYHLLSLRSELKRLKYLIGHLKITIPVIKKMNRTKELIQLNGAFKSFDPIDFEDFKM